MMAQTIWRPEIVMVIEPTALCVPVALLTSWLSHARRWRHIQDFEIDAGFATGMLNSRMLRVIIAGLDKKSLTVFDRVSTISPKMMDRLHQKGFPAERSVMFPNWVDTRRIFPTSMPSPLRQELGIARDSIVALYSGTMGRKQGLEILAEAAERLAANKRIQFVFCGDGAHREALASRSAHLPNVHWLPLQPLERLNELLNLADIHLLPQLAGVADLMMPSKLTGILASGRPVVTTADPGTQLALAVQHCGVRVPAHDGKAFAESIDHLAEDVALRVRLGQNARRCAEATLDKEKLLTAFERECLEMVRTHRGPESSSGPENGRRGARWKSTVDVSS
jgi:colanic acid biosynthesis glycosyl transferase WcaI